jgi:hypothetical protein
LLALHCLPSISSRGTRISISLTPTPPARMLRHGCQRLQGGGEGRAPASCSPLPPFQAVNNCSRAGRGRAVGGEGGVGLCRSPGAETRWQLTGLVLSPSALASIVNWVVRNLGLIERAPHCLKSLGDNRGSWKPIRPAALAVIVPNLATRAGKLVGNKFFGS